MSDPFENMLATPDTTQDNNQIDLEELPIEIITLSDSFIESLTAPIHPTPPSIDRLRQLFQEFYDVASTQIATHLNAKFNCSSGDTTQSRGSQPLSIARRLTSRSSSFATTSDSKIKDAQDEQMLTSDELAAKRQARKQLESKRIRLEEAVERRISEGIYDKIYRHRSTHDAAADERLRSRTAALAIVGINPSDLGLSLGKLPDHAADEAKTIRQTEIRDWLEDARKHLVWMHGSRYPLGKLNHLKDTHRAIVETLAHFHPSSSADEILPMLIYTLITLEPSDLNVVSDLHFIQNFRWEARLTGEAAYCLTNLEAAIGFLQTVNLSTLRADEYSSGPPRGSESASPESSSKSAPLNVPGLLVTSSEASPLMTTNTVAMAINPQPTSRSTSPAPSATSSLLAGLSRSNKSRTLSDFANTPAAAMGVASEILTTADQSLKNISTSLGDSYKFFINRVREPATSGQSITVPKTLEDARQLINASQEDAMAASSVSSIDGDRNPRPVLARQTSGLEDRMMDLIGGRRIGNHAAGDPSHQEGPKDGVLGSSPSNTAMLDSVRNFGSSLNPMARLSSISNIGNIGNIGSFRGFGRPTAPPAPPSDSTLQDTNKNRALTEGGDLTPAFPDLATALPPKEHVKLAPPIKRFIEMQNPGDIRLSEVLDLLRDYRRLANALEERKAFS